MNTNVVPVCLWWVVGGEWAMWMAMRYSLVLE